MLRFTPRLPCQEIIVIIIKKNCIRRWTIRNVLSNLLTFGLFGLYYLVFNCKEIRRLQFRKFTYLWMLLLCRLLHRTYRLVCLRSTTPEELCARKVKLFSDFNSDWFCSVVSSYKIYFQFWNPLWFFKKNLPVNVSKLCYHRVYGWVMYTVCHINQIGATINNQSNCHLLRWIMCVEIVSWF